MARPVPKGAQRKPYLQVLKADARLHAEEYQHLAMSPPPALTGL